MTTDAGNQRFELAVGRVLRLGVLTSSACLAAGLVMAFAGDVAHASGPLLTVGLLLLMATPAARLLVSSIAYTRRREWIFVWLTLIVAAELAASVFAALRQR